MRDMIADKMELEERGWKVVFFLLPVIGLALLVWGGTLWRRAAAREAWPVTPGTVIASKVEKIEVGGKTRYEARVSFRYSVDKIEYVSDRLWLNPELNRFDTEAKAQRVTLNLPVNSPLTVHFDPDHPDSGVINLGSIQNLTLPLALGAVLIIFFLLTEIHHHVTKDPEDQSLHLEDDAPPAKPAE
jgi:hypothetical protein